jgi:hypothetical protein
MILFYLVSAILVSASTFAVADNFRRTGHNPTALALVAGLLWPVLAVGAAQLLFVVTASRFCKATTSL